MNFIFPVPLASLASGGYLLGKIGSWADLLHETDAVVGNESDPQQILLDRGIGIDHLGNVADKFYYRLGHGISRCGLATEEHRAAGPILDLIAFDAVIVVNHVQGIEQLTFILVDAFDLDVEHRLEREIHAGVALDHLG